jgi:hypothetical protein
MGLTREQILAAGKREVVTVDVPAWGGPVCLRPLSGAEITEIYRKDTDNAAITRAIVAASICDADGGRLFAAADADTLFDLGYAGLQPLIGKALEINRMTAEAVDAARKA